MKAINDFFTSASSFEKIFYPPQKLPSSGVELLRKINNQVVRIEKAH
ncbi:hypothetical protein [Halobacteriovorax marinus]